LDDRSVDPRRPGAAVNADAGTGDVIDRRIPDVEFAASAADVVDPVLREPVDLAIFDNYHRGGVDLNGVDAGISRVAAVTEEALNLYFLDDDDVGRCGRDIDAVRARHQNRGDLAAAAVERNGFGDGDGAEAARIERVDFAAVGGLRDGAGPCLARRRAAARIDVVADARHPGARGLRVGGRNRQANRRPGQG